MKPPSEVAFAAFVGIDWSDTKHDICLQAGKSEERKFSVLKHGAVAIDAWASALRQRFRGRPVGVCLELAKGPLDAFDANASDKQSVANHAPMPAVENRSGAYERAALSGRQFRDPLNVSGEPRRLQFAIPQKVYRASASEPGKEEPFHHCKYRAILARRLEHDYGRAGSWKLLDRSQAACD